MTFTKAKYHFVEINPETNAIIPESAFSLDIVSSIDFDDPRAIIIYETVGGDGGYALSTGRKTQTVTINARFISNVRYDTGKSDVNGTAVTGKENKLENNIKRLKQLRDLRKPFYIYKDSFGMGTNFFGKYIIENVSGSIGEADTSIPVTIKLIEYKALTIKRNLITNVSLPPSAASDTVGALLTVRNKMLTPSPYTTYNGGK